MILRRQWSLSALIPRLEQSSPSIPWWTLGLGNSGATVFMRSDAPGEAKFAKQYWPGISRGADYLVHNASGPPLKMSTDDFTDPLARNANHVRPWLGLDEHLGLPVL